VSKRHFCTYLTHRFGGIEIQPQASLANAKNHQDWCTIEIERLLGNEISTGALEQLAANDSNESARTGGSYNGS